VLAARVRRYRHRVPAQRRAAKLLAAAALALAACGGGGGAGASIGAVLGRDNDTQALYVRDVPDGLGAAEAGLIPGDEILMIDGRYARDLDQKQVVKLLRGAVGTSVELTVVRGSEVRHVRVKRTALHAPDEVKPKEETITP
jgi:C-terminal processing protease CtpA/Prc